MGKILRKLSERKHVKIIAAEYCPDHVHRLVAIPPHLSVSQYAVYGILEKQKQFNDI